MFPKMMIPDKLSLHYAREKIGILFKINLVAAKYCTRHINCNVHHRKTFHGVCRVMPHYDQDGSIGMS